MRTAIKYCRGQIWFIKKNLTSAEEKDSDITDGARPYLIISNDMNNSGLGYVTALACSQRSGGGSYYTDVMYHSQSNDTDSVVLCNQIRMIPKSILDESGYYLETLDKDTLREVDDSISIALGFKVGE